MRGAAQSPRTWPWPANADGPRTTEQAVALAKRHGVVIPREVVFILDEWGLCDDPAVEAFYLRWRQDQGPIITWPDFYRADGKIPVYVRARVLESDEAIVAVFGHEMHELNQLRELFAAGSGSMSFARLFGLTSPGIPGNLHDQAWDVADRLVTAMKETPR